MQTLTMHPTRWAMAREAAGAAITGSSTTWPWWQVCDAALSPTEPLHRRFPSLVLLWVPLAGT